MQGPISPVRPRLGRHMPSRTTRHGSRSIHRAGRTDTAGGGQLKSLINPSEISEGHERGTGSASIFAPDDKTSPEKRSWTAALTHLGLCLLPQRVRGIRRPRGMGRSRPRQRRIRGRQHCRSNPGALAASGLGTGVDDPRRSAEARRFRRNLRRRRAAQGGRGRTDPQGSLHHPRASRVLSHSSPLFRT